MENKIAGIKRVPLNRSNINKAPESPGVYIFRQKNRVLYIGKSINIRKRLLSYTLKFLSTKTRQMVKDSDSISWIMVFSELESLLLESFLIGKFKPKYNVISKDDKSPLYIIITNEIYPRVLTVRKSEFKRYKISNRFGPYASAYSVKNALRLIRKIIPYSDHLPSKKTCVYSQMKLCNPCPNAIDAEKNLKRKKELVRTYKLQINQIKNLLKGNFSKIENEIKKEMNYFSKNKMYEEAAVKREQLKLLTYTTSPKTEILEFLKNPNLFIDQRDTEVKKLKKILEENSIKVKKLDRIECYDIAHISGAFPAASMVVFKNKELQKTMYRHYKIRQTNTQSDYDSLKEVARRRLIRIKNGSPGWEKPDLILVDGGIGQVRIFVKVFKDIPIIGIAKNPDRIIFPNGKKIKPDNTSHNFISRLRDEAHRFANRYHHKLLSNNLLTK